MEQTGHIWVHYDDRGDRGTWTWVIDARTGQEVASYSNPARRRLLPPSDQAVYDAWTRGRGTTQPVAGISPDGPLTVSTRSARVPDLPLGQRRAVQRSTDQAIIARFTFVAAHSEGAVERVVFEDDRHLLVQLDYWPASRVGAAQTVVRCDIPRGTCQRALPIRGQVALGVLAWSVVS